MLIIMIRELRIMRQKDGNLCGKAWKLYNICSMDVNNGGRK